MSHLFHCDSSIAYFSSFAVGQAVKDVDARCLHDFGDDIADIAVDVDIPLEV
jgi:hypothetical protein